ncbi:MAG: beta-ketoacyl-[acyl-carrier-protein] synthase family protein [bacterium]
MKRVVITGMGAVTPLGGSVSETIQALDDGRHAIRRAPELEACKGLRSWLAAPAELKNEKLIPRQNRRSMSRMSIFAAQAAQEAARVAGYEARQFDAGRVGCVAGSTTPSPMTIHAIYETFIPTRDFGLIQAMQFFQSMSHTVAMNLAQYLGLQGRFLSTNAACASGLQAIGTAYELIRAGSQDAIFCGGAEEYHSTVTGVFDMLLAASTKYNDDPDQASRPFDAARDGLVCGEGAGILFLEEREHALARGATIYGEILGFDTCSGGTHISESNRECIAQCMRQALVNAACTPADIGYVSAHATATLQGDGEEAAAIHAVLGDAVPVSSLKGHLGHTLGASGPIEMISTIAGLRKGRIYPTRNLTCVAEECKGIRHVTEIESSNVTCFMKNSFAFGGINASLVCRV